MVFALMGSIEITLHHTGSDPEMNNYLMSGDDMYKKLSQHFKLYSASLFCNQHN